MNRARIAALLRELAAEVEADDLCRGCDQPVGYCAENCPVRPREAPSKPQKRRPRVRLVPPPKGIATPVDREAARTLLRREGLR